MFFLEARDSEAEAAVRRALEIDGIDGTNPADRYLLSKSTVVADEHSPRLAPPLPIMPTALGATPLRGQNHNAGGKLPPLLPYSRTSAIIHRSSWQNFICSSTLVSASSRFEGHSHVLYVCKYANGKKILLIVAWKRRQLPQDADAANA